MQSSIVDDVLSYLNSQTRIKLILDPSVNTQSVADALKSRSFVRSVQIETKEETLNLMKSLFEGKPYLFQAFQAGDFPDSLLIEVANEQEAAQIAEKLKSVAGVTDVFYPQKIAQAVLVWSHAANRYGIILLVIFLLASLLTVSIAIHLALYQRQKEIRVKLLLGAKTTHVRGQFIFEGCLLGLIGSILASLAIYFIFQYALVLLALHFSTIFHFSPLRLDLSLLGIMAVGTLIGLMGSYYSTGKLIKHA
jgi:cell division transport system permease protein